MIENEDLKIFKFLIPLFLLSVLLGSLKSFAGGSVVSGGGSSVVCFSIPVDQAMHDGRITQQGAKNIRSAQVLEFYLASLKRDQSSPFFQKLHAGDPKGAVAYLRSLIAWVPMYDKQFGNQENLFGTVEDGIKIPTALDPINDSDLVIGIPEGCAQVQTVIRRNQGFFVDRSIWNALKEQDPVQQQIMQFHEIIYSLSENTQSSAPTQALLVSMMSDPLNKREMTRKVADTVYGSLVSEFGFLLVDPVDATFVHNDLIEIMQSAVRAKPDLREIEGIRIRFSQLKTQGPVDPVLWARHHVVDAFERSLNNMFAILANGGGRPNDRDYWWQTEQVKSELESLIDQGSP